MNGHKLFILKEKVPECEHIDISLWRKQDQNKNQATHEIEVLQTILYAAKKLLDSGKAKVNLGELVAAATQRHPSKLSAGTWFGLARHYVGCLENGVLD